MKTIAALTSAVLAFASVAVGATTVTTDPVGYVTGTCKANSDTVVSVPLAHAPEFVGTLSATASIAGDNATITAAGTSPAWTANQFAALYSSSPSYPTYYVKFKCGALNGKYFTVTANDASTITFDSNGDDITGAVAGDQFAVIKYWTLGEMFPAASQTTFVKSAGTLGFQRKSILLLPDLSGTGINLAPNQRFFVTSEGWKKDTTNFPDASNQILLPDVYFIVRHPESITTDTTFTFLGDVNTSRTATPLTTRTAEKQDNFVALQRPVSVTLAQSGLSDGFVASANTLGFNRRDVLYMFDNSLIARSKAPSRRFFMVGSDWIEDTTGFPVRNDFTIDAGTGFIIRKYQTSAGKSVVWTNDPNY